MKMLSSSCWRVTPFRHLSWRLGLSAQHTLRVALTKPLRNYVGGMVALGHYARASEVVRAGLRPPIEKDALAAEHEGGREAHRTTATRSTSG
jgi:putative addiction module CopG family antidote